MSALIRIATRKSPLALWQARHVAEGLTAAFPGIQCELVERVTQGDRILDAPLARIGGKGLFVKELEQGLLDGSVDLAVHSMKDMPAELPEGLVIGAILPREDPRDALISDRHAGLSELPTEARIGTSSLRRQCQIRVQLPRCQVVTLRGNVGTRLEKLRTGGYDAILLAAAGLKRLNLGSCITEVLSPEISLPAVGQGAIGVECRRDDSRIQDLLAVLHHPPTAVCVEAERALNERLHGGCQVPIAGFAELAGDRLWLRGLVAMPDGSRLVRGEIEGPVSAAQDVGNRLAEELLARGADRILRELFVG